MFPLFRRKKPPAGVEAAATPTTPITYHTGATLTRIPAFKGDDVAKFVCRQARSKLYDILYGRCRMSPLLRARLREIYNLMEY